MKTSRTPPPTDPRKTLPIEGFWCATWRRLRRNRPAFGSLIFLALLLILTLIGPMLSPYSSVEQRLDMATKGPSLMHWLGTDSLGRDLLTRLAEGGRISLLVGFYATLVALGIGVTYGAVSGYVGGRTDTTMMRLIDMLYAVPFTILVIVLMVVFEQNFALLFVAIGAVEWLTMARIVRGQVLSIKTQPFVQAASALGYSHTRIIGRHILPNVIGPIVVYATLTIPHVILLESFISFLGLGVQPPNSSWGLLIRDGAQVMEYAPWMLIFPGLALSATLFALNFLGDGLRDALDPRFEPRARRG